MTDRADEKKKSLWDRRRWRMATGLNVCVAVVLAAALLGMVNYLLYRLGPLRWNLNEGGYYALSDKTQNLLSSLERDVRVVAFFNHDHELFNYVRTLLKEYEYECARLGQTHLKIEILDPSRDLARTRALQQKYRLAEPNVVVFDSDGRCKYVEPKDIVDKQHNVDFAKLLARKRDGIIREVTYLGEQAFSSAILSVTQGKRPIVYFLTGHGEREIDDFSKPAGFSSLARALQRDNMVVRKLEHGRMPDDCSLLVIAGPTRKISRAEIDMISSYLDKNGRLLVLLTARMATGLDELLETWGVKLDSDLVIDPVTLTGQEIFVSRYGNHPITRRLKNVTTVFYMPRSVEPAPGFDGTGDVQADKSRVFTLASSSEKSWAERDSHETPPKFDAKSDRQGPISLAVAVEKGVVSGIEVEIKPTRIVVIGDTDLVSNLALEGAVGGNIDFFLSAANWLVDRGALMGIGPKSPEKLSPAMNRVQKRVAFGLIVLAGPFVAAVGGILVWWRRRS